VAHKAGQCDNGPVFFDLPTLSEPVKTILQKQANTVLPLTRSLQDQDGEDAQKLRLVSASELFPGARHPDAALSGLFLLLNCWNASHHISQDIHSKEGSYWHGIAHRIEPDSWNAAYWFRQVGAHPIFPELHGQAQRILDQQMRGSHEPHWQLKSAWDPFRFIEWCDEARAQPGTASEKAAVVIQQAEWQLLFRWCTSSDPM
jgi:hypothetical protein